MNEMYDGPINEMDAALDARWEGDDVAETAAEEAVRIAGEDARLARWPAERRAAEELARAQQRLAEGEAAGLTDSPDEWHTGHLGYLRARVEDSLGRAGEAVERGHLTVPPAATAAAVARARDAVAALSAAGSDPVGAEAARVDVLGRWPVDDQVAERARGGGGETGAGPVPGDPGSVPGADRERSGGTDEVHGPGDDDRGPDADWEVAPRYRDVDVRGALRLMVEDVRTYVSASVGGARAAAGRAAADRAGEEEWARREEPARRHERDRDGVEDDGTTDERDRSC